MDGDSGFRIPGWLWGVGAAGVMYLWLRNKNGAGSPGAVAPGGGIPGMPAPDGGPSLGPTMQEVMRQDHSGVVGGGALIMDPFAPTAAAPRMSGMPQRTPSITDARYWRVQPGQAGQAGSYEDLSGFID